MKEELVAKRKLKKEEATTRNLTLEDKKFKKISNLKSTEEFKKDKSTNFSTINFLKIYTRVYTTLI